VRGGVREAIERRTIAHLTGAMTTTPEILTPAAQAGLSLLQGEQVRRVIRPWWFATILYYVVTLGLWEIWRRRNYAVMTDQRVIIGHGIVLLKRQQNLPLAKIQDASYSRRLWVADVLISSAGGELGVVKRTGFRPARAKEFVAALNSALPRLGEARIEKSNESRRQCPHCQEAMRRDASVCPHCRRESPAWNFQNGLWWTNAQGDWYWLDEPRGAWVKWEAQ